MKIDYRALANQSILQLTPYQPGKPIEELERELGITAAIKLASNENPLGASSTVIKTAQAALLKSHFYPDGGCFELKQALANFYSLLPDQITIGNGSENILELLVKAYLHPNATAIISEYAFLTIPILLQSYAVKTKVVTANNWGHDIAAMIAAIDDNTRMLFLVNPNNPTGTYTHTHDFELLLNQVPPHVIIVVDEAYAEYISAPDYPNTLSYLSKYPNLVITRTFSKAYGLAALRLGYAFSSTEIADILNRARLPFNVNTIAAIAARTALLDQDHVQKSVTLNQEGMQQMTSALAEKQICFIPSIGNFIAIEVLDALTQYHRLLNEGVIVRPLHAYHMPKHIRVTIGTYEQNERFLKALHQSMYR